MPSHRLSTPCTPCALAALLLAALPASAFALPTFDLSRTGLTGPAYTQTGDFSSAAPAALNDANQVIGTSLRFSGNTFLGQDAWLYDFTSNSNIPLGLTGGIFTSAGTQSSTPLFLNPLGQVAGTSVTYDSLGNDTGQAAWFYDFASNSTTLIGNLPAPINLTFSGGISATPVQLSSSQFAAGTTTFGTAGSLAWLYDNTTHATLQIGLTDPAHTQGALGIQSSVALRATTAGTFRVIGTSQRYTASTPSGQDAFLFTAGGASIPIGYTDPSLYDTTLPIAISNAGTVIGNSTRYSGNLDAWRYLIPSATLQPLGLADASHTSPTGATSSSAIDLNQAGDAIGTSVQFVSGVALGQSAWVQYHNSPTAIQIGLTGPAFQTSGAHTTTPAKIAPNGVVAGTSAILDNPANGNAAWAFDPLTAQTTRIGLTSAPYTQGSFQDSEITDSNAAGQIIGTSTRFDSNGANPTAWFYDPATLLTTPISGPGILYTLPQLIGDDGVVLGSYTLFDGAGNPISQNAFYWTLATGALPLGLLVNNGLAANDFQSLQAALARNASGAITGTGLASNQSPDSTASYLLTLPQSPIPEPASLAVLLLGTTLLLPRRSAKPWRH